MRPLSVGLRLPRDGEVAEALEETVRRLNQDGPPSARTSPDKLLTAALEDPEVVSAVVSYLENRQDGREEVASALEREAAQVEEEARTRAQEMRERAKEVREGDQEEEGGSEEEGS